MKIKFIALLAALFLAAIGFASGASAATPHIVVYSCAPGHTAPVCLTL